MDLFNRTMLLLPQTTQFNGENLRANQRFVVCLLSLIKEKSWSVKLVSGYVLNSQVKTDRCKGCNSIPKMVVGYNGDPDLFLYGCNGHKCKHTLIRLKFASERSPSLQTMTPTMVDIQVSSNA
jgi:hypothetical protein